MRSPRARRTALFLLLFAAACSSSSGTPATSPASPAEPPATPVTPAPAKAPAADPPAPTLRLDPELAQPTAYDVSLTVDPSAKTFDGDISIDVTLERETRYLWLNANELEIHEAVAAAGGDAKPARLLSTKDDNFVGFELPEGRRSGKIVFSIRYSGKVGDDKDFDGLFVQAEKGAQYLYTQFEPIGARQAFPCFDQPEFKVPWTLHITVPSGQLAFANTPETGRREAGDKTTFDFSPTKPLPSYLIAFAAGPFSVIDMGKGGRGQTPMRIVVPKGREGEVGYAKAQMKDILDRLESYFGIPYPYAKLDSVVIPHFFGAMENAGMITYASSILLNKPDEVSPGWEAGHLRVVAHEMAHQWFGDLVTLRWWDDLWLNESFAEWMAQKVLAEKRPDFNPAIRRVQVREEAMGSDSLPSATKIHQDIRSEKDFFASVGSIIYQKGASVIGMFEAWIGKDKFRHAVRGYLAEHAYKTTVAEDFFAALAGVSDPALPAAFSTFIDQTGFPVIETQLECKKGAKPEVALEQQRYSASGKSKPASGQWKLPVCLKYGVGGKTYTSCQLVSDKKASMALSKAARCPDWVLGNAESAGYYRVLYKGKLLSKLLAASRRLSPADRVGLIADVEALMRSGEVEVGTALGLIPRMRGDKSPYVVMSAAGIAQQIREVATGKLEANYRRFIRKTFGARARRLGWVGKKGESNEVRELRSRLVPLVAIDGQDKRLLAGAARLTQKWLKDPSAIEPDMLGATLRAAAKGGDAKLYDKLLAMLGGTEPGGKRSALVGAISSFDQPTLTERTLKLSLDDKMTMRDFFGIFQTIVGNPGPRRQRIYDFLKANYDAITAKLPPMAKGFLVFSAVPFCDEAHKKDAKEFFGPKAKDSPNGDRPLKQAMDAIDVCVAQRARSRPGVARFLRKY